MTKTSEDEYEPDDDEYDEYEYEENYASQAAYAKSARPPMLETIRSYSADKQPPVPGKKTTEHNPERGTCVFEAKTASAYKASEWENDAVPEEYVLQIQHYMAVTGY